MSRPRTPTRSFPIEEGASHVWEVGPPNMPFQRTRVARFARSGSPLNGRPLDGPDALVFYLCAPRCG